MAREYYNLPKHLGRIWFEGKEYEIHTIHESMDGRKTIEMIDINEARNVKMEYTPLERSEL